MSLLGNLKKSISSNLADARDIGTKSLSGGYDLISSIIDRPAQYTLSKGYDIGAGALNKLAYTGNMGAGAFTQFLADPRYEGLDQSGNPYYSSKFELGMPSLDTFNHINRRAGQWADAYKSTLSPEDRGVVSRNPSFMDALRAGQFAGNTFQSSENVSPFFKTALPIAADPFMYVPVGTVGKLGGALARVAPKAEPLAKLALGLNEAKATSRTARVLGGLVEGVGPKAAIPFAATSGLGAQATHELGINDPYGIVPMLSGGVGLAAEGRLARYGNANRKAGPRLGITPEEAAKQLGKDAGATSLENQTLAQRMVPNPSPRPMTPSEALGNSISHDWSRPRNPIEPAVNSILHGPLGEPTTVFNSQAGRDIGNSQGLQQGLPGQSIPVKGGPIEPVTSAGKGPRTQPFTAASEQEQFLRQDAAMRNQGIPETLGDQLNRIAWQHDDPALTAKINAEEAHRRGALKRNTVGFRRPTDVPIGNLRARADEMLAALPESELSKVMDPQEAINKMVEFAKYASADEIANARSARQIQFEEGLVKGLQKNPAVPYEPGIGGSALGGPKVKEYNVEARAEARALDTEHGGDSFVRTPATDTGAPTPTITSQLGLPDEKPGTKTMPDVRSIDDIASTIKSANDGTIRNLPVIKQILDPIYRVINNSMILAKSDIGKGVVARQIQRTEIEQKTNLVLSSLDSMSGFTGLRDAIGKHGSIFKTDDNGIIQGVNEHWNKVFSNPEKYKGLLNPDQIKYITQFNQIISDANTLLVANGFKPIPKAVKDELWIPRVVKGIDGIEVVKPTNHNLNRFWEDATEGVQKGGIDYADPREVAKLYVYGVYKQIADQRFAEYMVKHTLPVERFIDPGVRNRIAGAIDVHDANIAALKEATTALKTDPNNADLRKIFATKVAESKASKEVLSKAFGAFQTEMEKAKSQEYRKVFLNGGEFGYPIGEKIPVDTFFVPAMKGLKDENGLKLSGERVVLRPDKKILSDYVGSNGMIPKERESLLSKGLGAFGSSVRLASATFDAATPFNQNLVLLGSPLTWKAWTQATVNQYRAMMSPRFVDDYLTRNKDLVNEMINNNVSVGSNEFFEALQKGGFITDTYRKTLAHIPVVSTALEQTGKNTVGRLEAAMSMALITGRIEAYKAWKPVFGEGNGRALGQFVNNMTGGLDLRHLMASKSQRDIESTFGGFSPRLMRSGSALIGMAMKPTSREGAAALSTLVGLAGMGSAAFYYGNLMMGNSEQDAWDAIDPTSGKKFMALKTPQGYVGIGGFHRALVQFLSNSQSAIHHGSAEKFATWDATENPFLQFYIGRGAPGVALAQNTIEATTGVNANPYEDATGWDGFLRTEANSFLPMIVQSMAKNDSGGRDLESFVNNATSLDGIITNPLNFNGLRTTPFSRSEERDMRVQNAGFMKSDGTPAQTIDDLNKDQKAQFYNIYPVEKITKEDNVTKMYSRIKQEEDRYVLDLNTVAGTVRTKQEYRDYYKKRTAEKFAAIDAVKRDFSILPADRPGFTGSVMDYVNSKNTTPEDKAVADYYDISHKVPLGADGNVDFDAIAQAKTDFLKSLPVNQRAYVQKMTTPSQHISDNELTTEYDLVKKAVQPYFDANETVFNAMKDKSAFLSQFSTYKAYQSWEQKTADSMGIDTATLQSVISSKIKDYKVYNTVLTNYKKAMRLTDPTLDVMLTDWYGIRPANQFNYINVQHGAAPSTDYAQEIYANPKLNSSANAYRYASSLPSMSIDTSPARRPTYSLR